MVAGRLEKMSFGGVEVRVETVPVPGSEKTSTGVTGKVVDALEQAQTVIVAAAQSTLSTMIALGTQAAQPDKLEIEFGVGFGVKGDLIVTGASANASLKVKLTYEPHTPPTTGP